MKDTKSVFVSIIGRTNVGKSSLMNLLVGEKIAIVTRKPQTTRNRITGILTEEEMQYVFIDTPGFHVSKNKLSDFMLKEARRSVSDMDVVVMVVEPYTDIRALDRQLLERLQKSRVPSILIINKTDLVKQKDELLEIIAMWKEAHDFEEIIPMSVLKGNKREEVLSKIASFGKEGPHYFSDDMMTSQTERVMAAEMIREKLLIYTHEEIPHGTGVVVEKMKERKGRTGIILDIEATIFCERENHKGMIIGKGGEMLKRIGAAARTDMELFFDSKVNLQLWVKVKEDWRNREGLFRNMGYVDEE